MFWRKINDQIIRRYCHDVHPAYIAVQGILERGNRHACGSHGQNRRAIDWRHVCSVSRGLFIGRHHHLLGTWKRILKSSHESVDDKRCSECHGLCCGQKEGLRNFALPHIGSVTLLLDGSPLASSGWGGLPIENLNESQPFLDHFMLRIRRQSELP